MPLIFNIRHLENKSLRLQGEFPSVELELEGVDELQQTSGPLRYDLTLEQQGRNILVTGKLELPLACECSRCLKPFDRSLELPAWTLLLPLDGEEKVEVRADFVDLTPLVREDIFLAFPQHPLCEPGCSGLPKAPPGKAQVNGGEPEGRSSPTWAELDKLKF